MAFRQVGTLESAHRADLGQLGNVPTAAQRLDQENAGVHAAPQNVDVVSLVPERNTSGWPTADLSDARISRKGLEDTTLNRSISTLFVVMTLPLFKLSASFRMSGIFNQFGRLSTKSLAVSR